MRLEKITFEVETARVLEILSKEIYDSPLALLRENVQNAYDAILMRCTHDGSDLREATITVTVEPLRLVITDDGIGMTEEVLRNNFWKAGSSGKKTELARQSGVIGTFGIGAMANFGVCTKLRVETRGIDSDVTLISVAERAKLSFSQECIDLERVQDARGPGTILSADLDPENTLSKETAASYLRPYVAFLPVKVYLNEELVPTFPNAEYIVTQAEWDAAVAPNERTRATYLAENKLDDFFDASPAIVGDEMILRGHTWLYSVVKDTPPAKPT